MPEQTKPSPDFYKIYLLAEHYTEASNLLAEQAKVAEWGTSAPKLLLSSFAMELYLKCLFVIDNGMAPPRGHDLLVLFEALDKRTQIDIRQAFERNISHDDVLMHLHIINPKAQKFLDFDRSLKAAKNTFDKRRYLYEELFVEEEWYYADLLINALRSVAGMVVPFAGLVSEKK